MIFYKKKSWIIYFTSKQKILSVKYSLPGNLLSEKLITPNLGETILGGITRDSVVQLAKDMGIEVQERTISVQELKEANKNGTLKEIFVKNHKRKNKKMPLNIEVVRIEM